MRFGRVRGVRKVFSRKKKCHWKRWHKNQEFCCLNSRSKKRGRKLRVNRHHMTNKKHGGVKNSSNILWIRIDRHRALHMFFGNMKWEAIADSIFYGGYRGRKIFRGMSHEEVSEVLYSIFGVSDPLKCVRLMDRVSLAKHRITKIKIRQFQLMAA